MAISYPLTLPSAWGVAQITIRQTEVVGASESPFTRQEQLYDWQADLWEAELRLPRMGRDRAEEVVATLMALRTRIGSFLMGDPAGATPRGAGGGTPVVDGAGQGGLTLAVRGGPVSTTDWLKRGDWIQLGSGSTARLHKVLTPADTDGAGDVTLDIWPRLRYAPADGAAVTISNAVGLWRLADPRFEYSIEAVAEYGIAIACREKLP